MIRNLPWVVLVAALLWGRPSHASDVPSSIKDYVHTSWTQREGAPADIRALAQTPDGWYWLGTSSGVYRFDGVTFTKQALFPSSNDKSQSVQSLFVTREGDLWIGLTYGGAIELGGQDHSEPSNRPGLPTDAPIDSFGEDASHRLWVVAAGDLYQLESDRWRRISKASVGLPDVAINDLIVDTAGTVWLFTDKDVFGLRIGQLRFQNFTATLSSDAPTLAWQANDGSLWLRERDGVARLNLPEEKDEPVQNFRTDSLARVIDRDGTMWMTDCQAGDLCRYPHASEARGLLPESTFNKDAIGFDDHIMSGLSMTAMIDRNGDLWVGTKSGLDRFSKPLVNVVHFPDPLIYFSVTPNPDGSVWVGTASNGFRDKWWHVDGIEAPRTWGDLSGDLTAAFRDVDGRILMGGASGLRRFDGKSVESLQVPDAMKGRKIQSIMRDSSGRLWIAFRGAPVFQLDGTTWITKGGINALNNWHPIIIAAGQDGTVWFGYAGSEAFALHGNSLTHYSSKDGLNIGSVTAIRPGSPILIGGEMGLAALDGDHFRMLQTIVPNTLVGITGIVLADDGCYWLNTEVGAVRIREDDMRRATQDPSFKMPFQLIDSLSGMPGGAQRIRPLPSLTQGSDGRLWFAQVSGLAWMDPKQLPISSTLLRVVILTLNTGTGSFAVDHGVDLPVGTDGFRIVYTALGAPLPERVTFRYRLAGRGSDWQFAGTDRVANFAGLAPGNYRFELQASDDGESWTASPISLDVRIEPAFYQTLWFSILCALILLTAIVVLTRRHIHQSNERLRARLQIRHAERERIARDLHDTLLQGVQGLILRVHAATTPLPPDHPVSISIDQALERGEQILVEGRNRLLDLRLGVGAANNLTTRIAEFAEQCIEDHSAKFNLLSNDGDQVIVPIVGDEAFLIAREAVLNAFRHANARQISVELDYGVKELVIQVSDNGSGIKPDVDDVPRTAKRWGLVGMQERAAAIGAGLIIKSIGGQGTVVTLSIPAPIAYVREQ